MATSIEELLAQAAFNPGMFSGNFQAPAAPVVDEAAMAEEARQAAAARMIRANGRRAPDLSPPAPMSGEAVPFAQGPGAPFGFGGMASLAPPQDQPVAPQPQWPAPMAAMAPGPAFGPGAVQPGPTAQDGPASGVTSARGPNVQSDDDEVPAGAKPAQGNVGMLSPPLAAAVATPEPGILDRIGDFGKSIAPALLGAGAALQGDNTVTAAMLKRRDDLAVQQQNQNLTARALLSRGAQPDEVQAAVRNPDLLKALVTKYFETKPAQVVNGRLVREQPDGTAKVVGDWSDDKNEPKLSAGYQWVDPQNKSKGQVFIKGGEADPIVKAQSAKLSNPPVYEWVDPNDHSKGQVAIKGGPGEKVDAEVAGRLGLAKSFLGQLPSIRKRVEAGEITGIVDAGKAQFGMGGPGELRRQIDSGAEALLRMLTGAGMNMQEANNYVRRYQFSPTDTVPTVLSKLNQLERELNSVGETVGKGRGGWQSPSSLPSGKTSAGVSWSVVK